MYESVQVRDLLSELVSALDPDAVSGPTARELWGEFDRIERLGSAGKTLLARRVAAPTTVTVPAPVPQRNHQRERPAPPLPPPKRRWTRRTESPSFPAWPARSAMASYPRRRSGHHQCGQADRSAERRLLELAARASLAELRSGNAPGSGRC